jgi:hypothetical protein
MKNKPEEHFPNKNVYEKSPFEKNFAFANNKSFVFKKIFSLIRTG